MVTLHFLVNVSALIELHHDRYCQAPAAVVAELARSSEASYHTSHDVGAESLLATVELSGDFSFLYGDSSHVPMCLIPCHVPL